MKKVVLKWGITETTSSPDSQLITYPLSSYNMTQKVKLVISYHTGQ